MQKVMINSEHCFTFEPVCHCLYHMLSVRSHLNAVRFVYSVCAHVRAHSSHSSCLEARGHLGSWFSLSTLESWNQTWLSAISPTPYVLFTFHHLGTNEIS